MIGFDYIFDGVNIPTYKADIRLVRWKASNIDPFSNVVLRNSQIDRQDWHGTISNPTLAGARLIPIDGLLYGFTKSDRGSVRNIIGTLFQIDAFPTQGGGFRLFEFTDDDGVEKFLYAKVFRKPEYSNEEGDALMDFNLELISQDPLIRSKALIQGSGTYGILGGMILPTTLPAAMNTYIGNFQLTNTGDFPAPVKATITGQISNPKILNLTNGRFYRIVRELVPGEELVIDTSGDNGSGSVTIDGVNAEAFRAGGSRFLFADPGVNDFILMGDDYDWDDPNKASVDIEFNSAWL